jgi:Restriction endonuclease S subunits
MKNNDKMIVPKLRFKEFDSSQEWKKELIGDFLTESRIKGNKGNEAKKLTVKLWGKGVYEKDDSIQGSENTQYFIRKSGQFIYSKLDFSNQAFGIIPIELDGYESTVDLPCFDVKEGLDTKFLLEYVQRPEFYKKNGEIADGGRKAKRIQVETFLSFPLYKPVNKEEQQKIADCLTSLDDLINGENKKLELLKEHKKGLMQKLFPAEGETMPEWRFPEFRDSGPWLQTTLGDEVAYENGKAHENDIEENGRYIVVNSKFISTDGDVKKYTNNPSLIANKDDILMVLSDVPNGKAIAKCFYVDNDHLYTVNQRICKLTTKNYLAQFLYNIINRNNYFLKFDDGIKQTNLKKDDVLACPLIIPKDIKEQKKIADFLSSVDNLISEQAKKIEQLKEHKRGLMQGLFPSLEEVE